MNGLRCFNLQERVMPYLRAEASRSLARQGLRQHRIAEHLGVSQAMVSKYLRHAAKPPLGVPAPALRAAVGRAVDAVMAEEKSGRLPAWCPICPDAALPATAAAECHRGAIPAGAADHETVLANLQAAARRLEAKGYGRLAPEVSLNLAMCVADARDARGVAAIPGRFAEVRGTLRAVAPPEFGASQHLSDLLLRLNRIDPRVRAVACLRDDEAIRRAARTAKLDVRIGVRKRGELALDAAHAGADAIVDPGDFGIEPITYLTGRDALDVVDKARRILPHLPPRGAS